MNMKNTLFVICFLISLVTLTAQAGQSGFYLYWSRDHTHREPRPMYPLSDKEASDKAAYYLEYDDLNRLKKVSFYYRGQLAEGGNFGSAILKIQYSGQAISHFFLDRFNQATTNQSGVFEVRHLRGTSGFWGQVQYLNKQGRLINNAQGISGMTIQRDKHGRAWRISLQNTSGNIVPEHNGFLIAEFGYDKHDFAIYRRSVNIKGQSVNGEKGYSKLTFRFDKNGNFLSEVARDEKGKVTLFPQRSYASLRFSQFDQYGKSHRIDYFDQNGEPPQDQAFATVDYYPSLQVKELRFFGVEGEKSQLERGQHIRRYRYNNQGSRLKVEYLDINGKKVTGEKQGN